MRRMSPGGLLSMDQRQAPPIDLENNRFQSILLLLNRDIMAIMNRMVNPGMDQWEVQVKDISEGSRAIGC